MEKRESKYIDNGKKIVSRLEKNQELYEEINSAAIDKFDVFSNTTIIGDNETNQIDVEKIKKILDTKYNEAPKRRSIKIEEEVKLTTDLEDTKEYDINAVLNKAKSEIPVSYEEERVKKPNTDQYEILKNLDLSVDDDEENDELEEINTQLEEEKDEFEEENIADENKSVTLTKDQPKELIDLINTIVINEKKLNEENTEVALDLFEDLKADEGEEVAESSSEIKKNTEKKDLERTQIKIEQINLSDEEELDSEKNFETKETKFKKSDFESLDDDDEKSSIIFKIFIFLLIVGFATGMYFFLTNFLSL